MAPADHLKSFPVRSDSQRVVTFKIIGYDEEMKFPCSTRTTVQEAKDWLVEATLVDESRIVLFEKQGSYMRKQVMENQLQSKTLVKGIKNFKPEVKEWPHPIGILGAGYNGLKTAMTYACDNRDDYVLFDRNNKVGGYCWITGANKTSRLQTEFGSFHLWWGHTMINTKKVDYPNCNIPHKDGGWHIWPYKEEMQKHFKYAAEAFGIEPHIYFGTNILKCKVEGNKDAEERFYNFTVKKIKDESTFEVPVSVIYNYPGSLTTNRILDYPGEDEFDGDIRYGMNDDTPYDKLKGATVCILGNGAFSVENARTVLECGGVKAYIITRRKSLASPRLPCWFIHQGPLPTPGAMLLDIFKPMYDLGGWGDPWEFYAVQANEKRTNARLVQASRFGIGDVTFLMTAWNLLEMKVTQLKRCSHHALHLENGETIENCTVILKALGLLGDWSFDKLHGIKEMVGSYINGDYRRSVYYDPTGMDAQNFTSFSTGVFSSDHTLTMKFIYDYPIEWHRAVERGLMNMLPRHKEEPEIEKPAYLTNVQYNRNAGMAQSSMLTPNAQAALAPHSGFKYKMYHISHNIHRTMQVATEEWDAWQAEWKARGIEHDYTPYPYTYDMVDGWFKDYSARLGLPDNTVSIEGPEGTKDYKFNQEGQFSHLDMKKEIKN